MTNNINRRIQKDVAKGIYLGAETKARTNPPKRLLRIIITDEAGRTIFDETAEYPRYAKAERRAILKCRELGGTHWHIKNGYADKEE